MENRLGAAVLVAFACFTVLWTFKNKRSLAPADAERVKEQTTKVLRIEIEKHEREHLRKIPR